MVSTNRKYSTEVANYHTFYMLPDYDTSNDWNRVFYASRSANKDGVYISPSKIFNTQSLSSIRQARMLYTGIKPKGNYIKVTLEENEQLLKWTEEALLWEDEFLQKTQIFVNLYRSIQRIVGTDPKILNAVYYKFFTKRDAFTGSTNDSMPPVLDISENQLQSLSILVSEFNVQKEFTFL